jgi:hypothetical protein
VKLSLGNYLAGRNCLVGLHERLDSGTGPLPTYRAHGTHAERRPGNKSMDFNRTVKRTHPFAILQIINAGTIRAKAASCLASSLGNVLSKTGKAPVLLVQKR